MNRKKIFKLIFSVSVIFTFSNFAFAISAANQEANRAGNISKEIKINCLKEVKKTPFFYNTKVLAISYTAEQFAMIETWFSVKNKAPRKTYILCKYDSAQHRAELYEADEVLK